MAMMGNTTETGGLRGTGRRGPGLSNKRQQSGSPKGNAKATEARSRPLSDSNVKGRVSSGNDNGGFVGRGINDPMEDVIRALLADQARKEAIAAIHAAEIRENPDLLVAELDNQIAVDNLQAKMERANAIAEKSNTPWAPKGLANIPDDRSMAARFGAVPKDAERRAAMELLDDKTGNYSLGWAINRELEDAGFELPAGAWRGPDVRNNESARNSDAGEYVYELPEDRDYQQAYIDAIRRAVGKYSGLATIEFDPERNAYILQDDPRVRSDSFMHSTLGNVMQPLRDATSQVSKADAMKSLRQTLQNNGLLS